MKTANGMVVTMHYTLTDDSGTTIDSSAGREPLTYLHGYGNIIHTLYVEGPIEAFGANRCMMESDYPPDSRSAGYVPLWNALKHIVRGASPDDKASLFHRTAARVYRLDLPQADDRSITH